MIFDPNWLRLAAAAGFFIAAASSLRNYLLTKRLSNLWLWLSAAMALIGASQFSIMLTSGNPLWQDVTITLLLVSAVLIATALLDFEKELNFCVNCGSSTSNLPAKEKKKKLERMMRGW